MPLFNPNKRNINQTRPSLPDQDSKQLSKKPKVYIKTEENSELKCTKAKPPLISFDITCHIDLTRSVVDLSGEAGTLTRIPLRLISNADAESMSERPIVQSPKDFTKNHSILPQPVRINHNATVNLGKASQKIVYAARDKMDELLQNPKKRKNHERKYFKLAKITPENLPDKSDIRLKHPTLNMRGVIAAEDIPEGTPLPYSGHYMNKEDWANAIKQLSLEIQTQTKMEKDKADDEAEHLLCCYAWEGITYNGKKYEITAFGAGNIASMINHDAKQPNIGAAYMSTYDANNKPGPRIVVYFALRPIKKGEQLLVDYGKFFKFDESEIDLKVDATPDVIWSDNYAIRQAVKTMNTTDEEKPPKKLMDVSNSEHQKPSSCSIGSPN